MGAYRFLSDVERAVWRYLWDCFEGGGAAPSLREIGRAIHFSHTRVQQALWLLQAKGLVRLHVRDGRMAHRGILSVSPPDDVETGAADRALKRLVGWE